MTLRVLFWDGIVEFPRIHTQTVMVARLCWLMQRYERMMIDDFSPSAIEIKVFANGYRELFDLIFPSYPNTLP